MRKDLEGELFKLYNISLPRADMKRIIVHWTAGNYTPSNVDREHYHLLVDGAGRVYEGYHSIADNEDTSDGDYAAHTLNCNTGSIGIAACAMRGCVEAPFDPGDKPLSLVQWEVLANVAAWLCYYYNIPVSPSTVLQHGEVQKNLGVKQRGKWDINVLPWEHKKGERLTTGIYERTWYRFRAEVATALEEIREAEGPKVYGIAQPADGEKNPRATVIANGKRLPEDSAFIEDGHVFVSLRALADAFGLIAEWNNKTKTATIHPLHTTFPANPTGEVEMREP